MTEVKRDGTQSDIVEEALRRHGSGSAFFDALSNVCDETFAGQLSYDTFGWQFLMEHLTIGEVVDFCAEHGMLPAIQWHNTLGGPGAHVFIENYDDAEALRSQFAVKWLPPDGEQARADEDIIPAGLPGSRKQCCLFQGGEGAVGFFTLEVKD